jgi:hypothetical protein
MSTLIYRSRKVVRTFKDGGFKDEIFKSINLAKQESRRLQTDGLGLGQVSVVEKLPKVA